MKILIDIGHPAHVHYFKNFIRIMEDKGHTIHIIARDKEVVFALLDFYKFPYLNRGKGKKGLIGKLLYMLQADLFILKKALKLKPDLYLSAGSMYAAHVAWLTRKPHIAIDDTDDNAFQHLMYIPFTKAILTPTVFRKEIGKKQIRFDGFLELGSLHPKRYIPATNTPNIITGKYVIIRFVAWEATHDIGLKGLAIEEKYELVKQLSKYAQIVISSEKELSPDLQQYAYKTHPAHMHEFLRNAFLIVSESLTMSAEAVFLGTPAICISQLSAGTLEEEVKLGLIKLYRNSNGLIEEAIKALQDENYKNNFQEKTKQIINSKTDLTGLLVWFIESYPESFAKIKQDPGYYRNFS